MPSAPKLPKEATPSRRAGRREESQVVELFDLHNGRLILYCQQFVNDRQRAEDLTQDLWERVIRLRDGGTRIVGNPIGLLLTIARNISLDDIKRRRRQVPLESIPEGEHPTGEIAGTSGLEELVIAALDRLPLPQREVLILHTYSGYRFEEIAAMLGESTGAVKTRAWRARGNLARIIAELVEDA